VEKGGDSRGGGGLLRGGERAGSDARIHLDIFKLHIGSTIHYWHTHAQTHTHTHTHIHTHAHTHTTIHTRTHIRTHTRTLCVQVHMWRQPRKRLREFPSSQVCLHVSIYLHISTYIYVHVCIYVHIRIYLQMYILR